MRPPVAGVVARQFAAGREVVVDLDRRDRLDRIRRVRLIPVVDHARPRRSRDVVLNFQGDRIQEVAWNHVVRKRIADDLPVDDPRRPRIVDRVLHDRPAERVGRQHTPRQRLAEIAIPHPVGRHRLEQPAARLDLAELLEAVEEERAIAPLIHAGDGDRAAEAAAEVVAAVWRLHQLSRAVIRKGDAGAEFFVHVVLEQAAAERVRARLGRQVEDAAGDLAVLRGEVARVNGHLFERLDRGLHLVDANHQAMVVRFHAFDANLERIDRRAADLERAVAGNVAAGNQRDEGVRIADGRRRLISARAEIQRQRIEVFAGDARRNLRALRVEQRRVGDDVDFFGQVAKLKLGVDPRRLPDEDANALLPEPAEPRQLDVEVVGADGHLHQRVVARLRRDRFVPRPVLRVLGNDARARHDAAVRIDDGARDGAAVALREGAGGQSDHQRDNRQESSGCHLSPLLVTC